MITLHKILPLGILPVGLTLLALLAAQAFRRWSLVLIAAGWLFFASLPLVSEFLLHRLEAEVPELSVSEAPHADVVLVLSGILGPSRREGYPLNWGEGFDRFEAGVFLWKAGKAPLLVLMDPAFGAPGTQESEGKLLRKEAWAAGVPQESVSLLGPVGNTAQEAALFGKVARQRGWQRVLLVTSAAHMPRALERFQTNGLDFHPFPVDYRTGSGDRICLMDFFPSAGALAGTEIFFREWIGRIYYRVLDLFR